MNHGYLVALLSIAMSAYGAHPAPAKAGKTAPFSWSNPFSWCGQKPAQNKPMPAHTAATAITAPQAPAVIYPEDFLDDTLVIPTQNNNPVQPIQEFKLSAIGKAVMDKLAEAQQKNPNPSAAEAEELLYDLQAFADAEKTKISPNGLEVKQSH